MSALDLDAIEARAASVYPLGPWNGDEGENALETVTEDVPALIDAVRSERTRAEAAEAEVARLRSLLDVTARELVAAKASADGWREEATGLRAIVEGRDVAPTAQEIDAHDGAWVVRYLRPRDPKRGERVAFCGAGWRQNARDMAAQHETTWWLPLDREGRPTAWPVPA